METETAYDIDAIVRLVREPEPLPKPPRRAVRVRNTEELFAAVAAAKAGTTILLAGGTYDCRNLLIERDGIALRGESGRREDVTLDGAGAFGRMIVVKGASDVTVADLTMTHSKQYGIFMLGDSNVQRPRIHNVAFRNIWVRAVKGTHPRRIGDSPTVLNDLKTMRKVRPAGGSIRHCLFTNDRVKPFRDDGFDGDYVSGIDAMWLKDWTIADNAFVGIRGANGHARGAVFVWVHSENVVTERNVFVGCDRAVAYGNPTGERPHMTGGIVRNNCIVGGRHRPIEMEKTRDCLVAHNSIVAAQRTYAAISFDHGAGGSSCRNNLVDGHIAALSRVADSGNVTDQGSPLKNLGEPGRGWFVNPAIGDLRLTEAGIAAAGSVPRLKDVAEDFTGRRRGAKTAAGAFEANGL